MSDCLLIGGAPGGSQGNEKSLPARALFDSEFRGSLTRSVGPCSSGRSALVARTLFRSLLRGRLGSLPRFFPSHRRPSRLRSLVIPRERNNGCTVLLDTVFKKSAITGRALYPLYPLS